MVQPGLLQHQAMAATRLRADAGVQGRGRRGWARVAVNILVARLGMQGQRDPPAIPACAVDTRAGDRSGGRQLTRELPVRLPPWTTTADADDLDVGMADAKAERKSMMDKPTGILVACPGFKPKEKT